MKKLLKSILPVVAASLLAWGCEKDETKVRYEDGTAPVLTSSTTALSLIPGQENNQALKLDWTNPNYKFTTGISSQDVSYKLEFDTAGANFGSSRKYTLSIARDLTKSFTVADMNKILSGPNEMNLPTGRTYNIEVRAISGLSNGALPLISNVIKFTAKPFDPPPAVVPPVSGNLWATGNAFSSGWANPLPSPFDVSQKFKRVTNTLYELVVAMPGGGNYKLLQEQGNWGSQFHMLDGGTAEAGSFRQKDADPGFIGPAVAGTYKITVNFQSGKFTVVKQ